MAARSLLLAGACFAFPCLMSGQTPSDVFVTNQRSLTVPANIQESRRAEVKELLLYSSNDQGRTWQQVAAMPPTQSAFTFNAPLDGNYWLRVASIDQTGKQTPDNLYQGPPNQKVTIDTMKPLLRLKAPERAGDLVAVAWELQEDNPDWASFRLEYQPKDGGPTWTPIQATAGLTGESRFRPNTQGPLTIRLSFKDQAANQAFTLADLPGTVTTAGFQSSSGPALPPAPNPTTPAPPPPMFPGVPGPLPAVPQDPVAPPVAPVPTAVQTAVPPLAPVHDVKVPAPALEATKTFPNVPPPVATQWNPSGPTAKQETGKIVASSVATAQAIAPTAAAAPPQRQLPPLQYVNQPEITLEYELNRVGPSGIGSIDLWWTQNDGQTWELYAVDPESKSGTVSNGRHKRTVEVPGDGVFGFILVVKSRAGLGKAPPRAGDVPDIRVEVDMTAPKADLYEPRPDGNKANTLLLKWTARDNNLTATPIILEWAGKREGTWQAIAPPLPNTGMYSWQLPDGLPVQVYLRMRVRDLAGNEAVAVTANPQLVDLSEPEGRVINVSITPR